MFIWIAKYNCPTLPKSAVRINLKMLDLFLRDKIARPKALAKSLLGMKYFKEVIQI